MNFIYFLKEIYFKFFFIFFFFFISLFFFYFFSFSDYILLQEHTNDSLLSKYLNKTSQVKKIKWHPLYKEKTIFHIEYFTMETITYKLILLYIIFFLFFTYFFFYFQWKINISYPHEKKKHLCFFFSYIIFFLQHFFSFNLNIQNTKTNISLQENLQYYNIAFEPQITLESIIDSFFFYTFLFFLKYLIIIYTYKNNHIYRYSCYILIFYFLHIDIFYFIFSFFEIELFIILLKIIYIYFGDDRN